MSVSNENTLYTGAAQNPSGAQESVSASRKYLVFMINDGDHGYLKFGVDAEYVVEILNSYSITYLPMMPHYVPGIINMRGQIVPVMDMRLRLDKYASEKDLLLVLNYLGTQIGVLVDAVDRIVDIADKQISLVPSQENQRFVSGMCTIPDDGSTMMILDCERLLSHD